MNFVRLLPVVFSALLLAAHFYRSGEITLVVLALALPLMLLVKSRWVPKLVSMALVLGALEWVYTLLKIAMIRSEVGAPWIRMALILGVVALLTACSALVFRLRPVRLRYAGGPSPDLSDS